MSEHAQQATERYTVTDRTTHTPLRERLAADLLDGLAQDPPSIPPKWFYDEKGSLLFEQITELPEYYPTRTEEGILAARAAEIATLTQASALVELGSGASRKTRLLLDALTAGARPLLFVPLDVSVEMLTDAARRVAQDYPSVTVEAVAADFDGPLAPLPGRPGGRLVAFLGSTLGNFPAAARAAFLGRVRQALVPGDWFLLGADLVKSADRLVAAYDDAAGVTAAFNLNLIDVLARELPADLDPADFLHRARWNAEQERVEMRLRARRDLRVPLGATGAVLELRQGAELLTETSAKFRVAGLSDELCAAHLQPVHTWTDEAGDFSLTLARVVDL